MKLIVGMVIFLIVSVSLNIIVHYSGISSELYRLCAVRYLFLSVPAFILFDLEKRNKNLFPLYIICSIFISFIYLVYLGSYDYSPYILDLGWKGEQWCTYFYTYLMFICLRKIARILPNRQFLGIISIFGRYSWYIFLAQMCLLVYFNIEHLNFINDDLLRRICFVFCVFIVSITPILYLIKKKHII